MRSRLTMAAGAMVALALVASACGTRTATISAGPTTTYAPIPLSPIAPGTGPVEVLYAASLATVMSKIAPAFKKASGYTFVGDPGASATLESDIKGGAKKGDVFVSVSSWEDSALEGKSNGNWVSWYATFASLNAIKYTVTVLNKAPNLSGAYAFVEFLLGAQGDALLTSLNLDFILPPRVHGVVPTALNSVLPTS